MAIDEFDFTQQSFRTRVAGVTFLNDDGSSRQAALAEISRGDELKLVREPNNPQDKYAVAVFTAAGKQIGYVANPKRDRRLAHHLDMGGPASCTVVDLEYDGGVLAFVFRRRRRNFSCVIQITKFNYFNWQEIEPFQRESKQLEDLSFVARSTEKKDPGSAITAYREIIERIIALDSHGMLAAAWRQARHPINRLSMLLDHVGRWQEAYDEIVRYEQFDDYCGLYKSEPEAIAARKKKLLKKLN